MRPLLSSASRGLRRCIVCAAQGAERGELRCKEGEASISSRYCTAQTCIPSRDVCGGPKGLRYPLRTPIQRDGGRAEAGAHDEAARSRVRCVVVALALAVAFVMPSPAQVSKAPGSAQVIVAFASRRQSPNTAFWSHSLACLMQPAF
jgi:hypothetical protein